MTIEKIEEKMISQHEYTFLLNLYTELVAFPVVTSTFTTLSYKEGCELRDSAAIMEKLLENLLPKLQDRKEENC